MFEVASSLLTPANSLHENRYFINLFLDVYSVCPLFPSVSPKDSGIIRVEQKCLQVLNGIP